MLCRGHQKKNPKTNPRTQLTKKRGPSQAHFIICSLSRHTPAFPYTSHSTCPPSLPPSLSSTFPLFHLPSLPPSRRLGGVPRDASKVTDGRLQQTGVAGHLYTIHSAAWGPCILAPYTSIHTCLSPIHSTEWGPCILFPRSGPSQTSPPSTGTPGETSPPAKRSWRA